MDITETYIKMSDCEEIQGGWSPQIGDYVAHRHPIDPSSVSVVGVITKIVGELIFLNSNAVASHLSRLIYLPREDQLQKMVRGTFSRQLLRLDKWMKDPSFMWKYCDSMEQLWLAFVMQENHNKVWDGEDWK